MQDRQTRIYKVMAYPIRDKSLGWKGMLNLIPRHNHDKNELGVMQREVQVMPSAAIHHVTVFLDYTRT